MDTETPALQHWRDMPRAVLGLAVRVEGEHEVEQPLHLWRVPISIHPML